MHKKKEGLGLGDVRALPGYFKPIDRLHIPQRGAGRADVLKIKSFV